MRRSLKGSEAQVKELLLDTKHLLSVVIPTRDTRELTLRCLESVLQCSVDVGVLVVDDGSGDGTSEAIRQRFPEVEIIATEGASGFTRAANRGLGAVRGSIRLLLNSDTEVEPDMLANLIQAFAADARLGIAGAELSYPDGRPQWSGGREPTLLWLFALASAIPRWLERLPGYRRWRPLRASARAGLQWVSGCAFAIREDVWTSVGPFDESFQLYAQDLDLCSLARAEGWHVAIVPGCKVTHHHGATIGELEGSVEGREHPERLWLDLLRWVRKHRGANAERHARTVLRLGASLRLMGRGLATPWIEKQERDAWRRESRAFAQARRALLAVEEGP